MTLAKLLNAEDVTFESKSMIVPSRSILIVGYESTLNLLINVLLAVFDSSVQLTSWQLMV